MAISDGNVGIGTTSPQAKLHVEGGSSEILLRRGDGSQAAYISGNPTLNGGNGRMILYQSNGDDGVYFNSEGSSYFRGGRVGIGTRDPEQRLDVRGVAVISGGVGIGTTTPSEALTIGDGSGDGSRKAILIDSGWSEPGPPGTGVPGDRLLFYHDTDSWKTGLGFGGGNDMWFQAGVNIGHRAFRFFTGEDAGAVPTEKVTIMGNGNVGIGTTAPTAKLDVAGTVPGTHFLGTTDNQPLHIRVNNQPALRLQPGIGVPNIVGGSEANYVSGVIQGAFIGGGGTTAEPNVAEGPFTVVCGGLANRNYSPLCTLAGGYQNQILSSAIYSAIGGGFNNLIASGADYATVPGGQGNAAVGDYSFAAGRFAVAIGQGTFVWADSTGSSLQISANNQFVARCSGGVIFYSSSTGPGGPGVILPAGSGSWFALSDRNVKTNFESVNSRQILERLVQIPIQKWSYIAQPNDVRHIGPVAQEFHAAFGLGIDDKHIATVDADGVALAAIQGLNQKLEEQVKAKDARIAALEQRLERLERLLPTLAESRTAR
jgi:hypothetical protein